MMLKGFCIKIIIKIIFVLKSISTSDCRLLFTHKDCGWYWHISWKIKIPARVKNAHQIDELLNFKDALEFLEFASRGWATLANDWHSLIKPFSSTVQRHLYPLCYLQLNKSLLIFTYFWIKGLPAFSRNRHQHTK